jgi:hypothetical protein
MTKKLVTIVTMALVIEVAIVAGMYWWKWQDGQGVPRCFPWQTIDARCEELVACPPDMGGPGEKCWHGKLFAP